MQKFKQKAWQNIAIDHKLFLVLEDEGFLTFDEKIKSFYKMLCWFMSMYDKTHYNIVK